jgi:hypothetical protein
MSALLPLSDKTTALPRSPAAVGEVLGAMAGARPGHTTELSGIVSDGVSLDEVERLVF